MRVWATVLLIFSVISTSTCVAQPGTEFRDHLSQKPELHWQEMCRLLGVAPFKAVPGTSSLRVWNERASMAISTDGSSVTLSIVCGHSIDWTSIANSINGFKPEPLPVRPILNVKTWSIQTNDSVLALDLRYLIRRISEFDTTRRGVDGSTTFVDACDDTGRLTTFEVWSPDDTTEPLASELCWIQWTFVELVDLSKSSPAVWERGARARFLQRMSNVTAINLSQEKALEHIQQAFRGRIKSLASELRRTSTTQ